jgi:hypothetical protein
MNGRRTGYNPPHGPSADWVLTTANAAGPNGLTCLPKHGGARNKFLVSHLMTDQRCLTSAIARRSADREAIELLDFIRIELITETHYSLGV